MAKRRDGTALNGLGQMSNSGPNSPWFSFK